MKYVMKFFIVLSLLFSWVVFANEAAISDFAATETATKLLESILSWIKTVAIALLAIGAIILLIAKFLLEKKFSFQAISIYGGLAVSIAVIAQLGEWLIKIFSA